MDRALRIVQHGGKLTRDQVGLPDPLQEGRDALQLGAVMLMRVQDAYWQVQFLPHYSHRLVEVRVVRDEYRDLEGVPAGVADQM